MERGSKRGGSILVMVLIISTFIMVVATVSLRSGTLLYELALDRVTQAEHLRAAQALAYYGIAHCKLIGEEKRKEYLLSFDRWPPPEGAYEGRIVIEPRQQGYIIDVTICKHGEELGGVHTDIQQEKDGWRIQSMQAMTTQE